jgi:peptidoglycan-N-acetylmuramic acid deacetylase
MKKKLLITLLVMLLILSGCSNVNRPGKQAKGSESKKIVQSGLNNEDKDSKETVDKKSSPDETAPSQKNMSEKPIGWGMVRDSEHKTPEIPKETKELIDKYGAIFTGDESSKVIYFTFDEGYENGYTPVILDTLKEKNVKAAFFVTGSYIKQHPDYVKRMVREGHIVGNHTMTHPSLPTITNEKIKLELEGVDELMMKETGKKTKYLRPPKGDYTKRTLKSTKEMGYTTVFWSLAFRDWQPLPGGSTESYDTVMANIHPGAVVLLHAESKDDTEALPKMIDAIRAQGYEFKSLDSIR